MLWVQYEASDRVDASIVMNAVRKLAMYVTPYPVAAFDNGPFGIGLIAHDSFCSNSNSPASSICLDEVTLLTPTAGNVQEPMTDTQSSSGAIFSVIVEHRSNGGPGDTSGPDSVDVSSSTKFPSSLPVEGRCGEYTDNDGDHTERNSDSADSDGKCIDQGDGRQDQQWNGGSWAGGNQGPDDEENDENEPPPPKHRKLVKRQINQRFTGTVLLRINKSLKQELTISFGLHICPTIGRGFADCQVILDPTIIRASASFTDEDEVSQATSSAQHFYVTEEVLFTIGPSPGRCDPPVSVHPFAQHFAQRRTASTKTQLDFSFEASANPKAVFTASKVKGNAVEYDPVSLAVEPIFIGSGGRNDFQWRYRPLGPNGTNLEMSSINPPVHEATFRLYSADTPKSVKIGVQATFRRNEKLRRKYSPLAAAVRALSDIGAMHIVTRLDVNIGNESGDWFRFPGPNKEGCRLMTDVQFNGGQLIIGQPEMRNSGEIVSSLNNIVAKR